MGKLDYSFYLTLSFLFCRLPLAHVWARCLPSRFLAIASTFAGPAAVRTWRRGLAHRTGLRWQLSNGGAAVEVVRVLVHSIISQSVNQAFQTSRPVFVRSSVTAIFHSLQLSIAADASFQLFPLECPLWWILSRPGRGSRFRLGTSYAGIPHAKLTTIAPPLACNSLTRAALSGNLTGSPGHFG